MENYYDLLQKAYLLGTPKIIRKVLNSLTTTATTTTTITTTTDQYENPDSWSNGIVVKALDSQSRGPVIKTTGWLQGRLSLSSFRGR